MHILIEIWKVLMMMAPYLLFGFAVAGGLSLVLARVAELCARYGSRAADFCKHLNSKGESLLKTLPGFSAG